MLNFPFLPDGWVEILLGLIVKFGVVSYFQDKDGGIIPDSKTK
jgi:hypothetical protein